MVNRNTDTEGMMVNVTFDELTRGQSASMTRRLTIEDIRLFAALSGDLNPSHMNSEFAADSGGRGVVGHSLWAGTLISSLLGNVLPGPGTVYRQQDLRFRKQLHVGDELTVTITVRDKKVDQKEAVFDCRGLDARGETVVEGVAVVTVPTEKFCQPRPEMPEAQVQGHDHCNALIASCRGLSPLLTAVVHPIQARVILAVAEAVAEELINPVLIGPEAKIRKAAEEAGVDISNWQLIHTEHSHAAAAKSAEMAAQRKVSAIMKGSLHTDEVLSAVLPSSVGLRTSRRVSHVFYHGVPAYPKPLIITDAVVNVAPDLEAKADICQNAINFWRALRSDDAKPNVAILAAVETIMPKMQATLDAAALCKMADRGQITGGYLDGPLAMDNAISKEAAADKGIVSSVAGDADILVAPTIDAANIAVKLLTFLGKADTAGLVLGARVPIILTSRADNLRARLMSCALAVKTAKALQEGLIK